MQTFFVTAGKIHKVGENSVEVLGNNEKDDG